MDENLRQAAHMLIGTGIAVLALLLERDIMVLLLAGSIFIGFILADALMKKYDIPIITFLIHTLERGVPVPGKGAFYFTASALVCVLLFPSEIAAAGILALAVIDGVATLAGIQFGRHRIRNGKSVEGTFAGIAAGTVALAFIVPPGYALAASLVAGVVELFSPVDDNLTIPIAVCILLAALGLAV
jgi:dolichol kinase